MQEGLSLRICEPVSRNQPESSYDNEPTQIRPLLFQFKDINDAVPEVSVWLENMPIHSVCLIYSTQVKSEYGKDRILFITIGLRYGRTPPLMSGAFSTTQVYTARPKSKSSRSARVLNKLYGEKAVQLVSRECVIF